MLKVLPKHLPFYFSAAKIKYATKRMAFLLPKLQNYLKVKLLYCLTTSKIIVLTRSIPSVNLLYKLL